MKVGLIDIDSKIPNLALMKLSAWHKAHGHDIELTVPTFALAYDRVYISKVFTWTTMPGLPLGAYVGGTGYDLKTTLLPEVERLCPDYSLYNMDYSRGIRQIEKIVNLGVKVDFNQGLDARLIDNDTAKLLAKVRWWKPIRLACDNAGMKPAIEKAVNLLRKHGATPKTYFCYMLVQDDIEDAHERAMFLRGLGVDPFAQPYRPPDGSEPSREAKRFARWVNHKAIFKSVKWEDYVA